MMTHRVRHDPRAKSRSIRPENVIRVAGSAFQAVREQTVRTLGAGDQFRRAVARPAPNLRHGEGRLSALSGFDGIAFTRCG